jgi:hypothetical protein
MVDVKSSPEAIAALAAAERTSTALSSQQLLEVG